MTPGESLADIFLSGMLGGKGLIQVLARQIDTQIAAAYEDAAGIAERIAETYKQVTPQGRFTEDYRDGAADAAYHAAKLIREKVKTP